LLLSAIAGPVSASLVIFALMLSFLTHLLAASSASRLETILGCQIVSIAWFFSDNICSCCSFGTDQVRFFLCCGVILSIQPEQPVPLSGIDLFCMPATSSFIAL
jgi:hypothetical protein